MTDSAPQLLDPGRPVVSEACRDDSRADAEAYVAAYIETRGLVYHGRGCPARLVREIAASIVAAPQLTDEERAHARRGPYR